MATVVETPSKSVKRVWIFSQDEQAWSFDAVIRESHHSELTVTDNPVETGVVISDHAYMAPLRLEIEAAVGDRWVHAGGEQAADGSGNFSTTAKADIWASAAGRSVTAFGMIQNLQASAIPFSVQTGMRLYDDMLITSIDADQDHMTGGILRFRASLRQVQFVSTSTVTVPPRKAGATTRKASAKVTSGEKKPEAVTETQKQASILKQLISGDSKGALDALGKL